MNIVLLEPEIPLNTGNIGRTCAASGCALHLIKPLGFSLEDRYIKRSGLDYWRSLDVTVYESFTDFLTRTQAVAIYMATTKARRTYTGVTYEKASYIMFGRESAGIPEELLLKYQETCIRIPMASGARSLNLSNAAAIVLYEALRQQGFNGLTLEGGLHYNEWGNFI